MRRLAIMLYDSILLFSVLLVATALIMPLTDGEAVSNNNPLYSIYLLTVSYVYFTWQWTHGGQTLGMMSWKVQLQQDEQVSVNWKRASLRFFLAIPSIWLIGAGLIWSLFDREKRSLHGRFSKTRLVLLKKIDND